MAEYIYLTCQVEINFDRYNRFYLFNEKVLY